MGTRRSRHNKGRKPFYKDHHRGFAGDDAATLFANDTIDDGPLSAETLAQIMERFEQGWSKREVCEDLTLQPKSLRRVSAECGYYKAANVAARSARCGARTRAMFADPAMKARLSLAQKAKWQRHYRDLGIVDGQPIVMPPSGTPSEILARRPSFCARLWFWDAAEIADLRAVAFGNASLPLVSEAFGRTEKAIAYKAIDVFGAKNVPKAWALLVRPTKPREPRVILCYPFILRKREEHADMLAINELVPRALPPDIRADVCQSIMLAILEGKTTLDELRKDTPRLSWFIRKFKKDAQDPALVSLESNDDDRDTYGIASSLNDARVAHDHLGQIKRLMRPTQEEDADRMLMRQRQAAWWAHGIHLSDDEIETIYFKRHSGSKGKARLLAMKRRDDLFHEQHKRCAYCKCEMTLRWGFPNTVTRDHITPVSEGGKDEASNLVGACMVCNQAKGKLPVAEFLASLKVKAARHEERPDAGHNLSP